MDRTAAEVAGTEREEGEGDRHLELLNSFRGGGFRGEGRGTGLNNNGVSATNSRISVYN